MNNWLITGNVYADIIIVLSILLLIDLVIQEF